MNKWCVGCVLHHNAGWPSDHKNAKFNDWCCRFGVTAKKIVNHCKLHNKKETIK